MIQPEGSPAGELKQFETLTAVQLPGVGLLGGRDRSESVRWRSGLIRCAQHRTYPAECQAPCATNPTGPQIATGTHEDRLPAPA